jgi:isopenicillin N synthase-like dioxygenase
MHSDPALISLVFHDAPGCQPGALGLECLPKSATVGSTAEPSDWREVNVHGHAAVTILSGSILDRITSSAYPAARHRVAMREPEKLDGYRVAATFFFRPAPHALLRSPPSPLLPKSGAHPITFAGWQKKVATKYERHREPVELVFRATGQSGFSVENWMRWRALRGSV